MAWLRNRGFQSSHVIPNGQTVTPTDDIQILLNCANIWDKTYTMLSALLDDTTSLLTVINSNNAIDYLVRSMDFAGVGLVPVMTSDTTPSGVVSASDTHPAYHAYSAFDGASDTWWTSNSNITDAYLTYEFPNTEKISAVDFFNSATYSTWNVSATTLKFQYSIDGINYTDIETFNNLSAGTTHRLVFTNEIEAKYIRATVVGYNVQSPSSPYYKRCYITKLQYYAQDASVVNSSSAMSYIGANDYASNTLLGEDNPSLIPTMTSNTTPSGIVSASAEYSTDYKAFKAFDNDDSTRWASTGSTDQYIQYEFTSPQEVKKILIYPYFANSNSSAKDITIKCSNNGTDWNSLESYTLDNTDGMKTCILQNTQSATFWRIDIEDSYNDRTIAISTIRFYAKEYDSEVWLNAICNSTYWNSVLNTSIPTMTSNTTPSGVCSSTALVSGDYAWKSFDKTISTRNQSNTYNTSGGLYVRYEFPSTFKAYKSYIAISSTNSTAYNHVIKIQGSNDGSTWTDLTTNQTISVKNTPPSERYYTINGEYKYYQVYKVSSSGSIRFCINEFDVYGRENGGVQTWLRAGGITNKSYTTLTEVLNDTTTLSALMASADAVDYLVTCKGWAETICADSTAMVDIGSNNYASNTLLADSTWLNAICNSAYMESVLNVKVPTMTSLTTPSGVVSASSTLILSGFDYSAWKAFDNVTATSDLWLSSSSTMPQWIGYEFTSANTVHAVLIRNYNSSNATKRMPQTFKVQAYVNDAWVDISDTINNPTTIGTETLTPFINNVSSNKVRICITSIPSGGDYVGTDKLQFYGRKDV